MKPKDTMYTEDEMREALRGAIAQHPSQRALAEVIGISESMLSKMLSGERACGDRVAEYFGRKMIRLYVIPDKERNDDE